MGRKRTGKRRNNNNNAQDTNADVNQTQQSGLSSIVEKVEPKENQLKNEESSTNTVSKQDRESEVTGQDIQENWNTTSKRSHSRKNAALKKNKETGSMEEPSFRISGVTDDMTNELKKTEVVEDRNKNNFNAQDTNADINQSGLSNIVEKVEPKESQLKHEEVVPESSSNTVSKQDCESEVTGKDIQEKPTTTSKRAQRRKNAALKKNKGTVSMEEPPFSISGDTDDVAIKLPNIEVKPNIEEAVLIQQDLIAENKPNMCSDSNNISPDSKLTAMETKSDRANVEQERLVEENKTTESREVIREDSRTISEPAGSYNFLPQFGKAHNEMKANRSKPITRFSLSVRTDVKLKTCENAWRPSHVEAAKKRNQEEQETNTLYKNFRSMLNKLTPEKFQILTDKILLLNIETSERMRGIIDMIFEKSISEPKFSTVYAQLCSAMANIVVFEENRPKKCIIYLITRCQREFEKDKESDGLRKKKLKEIQNCVDVVEKKVLQDEFDEYETWMRKKSVGAVKFIGELYKQKMLTASIMLRCLSALLSAGDEESLEGLCKLLTTVGEMLEKSAKQNVSEIMKTMHGIAIKKPSEVSSRIRFMLLDSIDLRLNGWVPRLESSAPKKIMEINMEAQEEEIANMIFPDPMLFNSNDTRSKSTDEPATVQKPQKFTVEFSRLKRNDTLPANDDLGKTNPFKKWRNGSQCTRRQSSSNTNLYENANQRDSYYLSNNIWPDTIRNKQINNICGLPSDFQYKSCDNLNYSSRRSDSFSNSNRLNDLPKQSLHPLQKATSNVSIFESASNLRAMRYSLSKNMSPTLPLKKASSTAVMNTPASKPESMTPEVISKYETAFKNTVEEYCAGNCSITECIKEFQDIPRSLFPQIVEDTILTNLERSKNVRTGTGEIFALLVKSQTVAKKDFSDRLKIVFSYWEDFVIDIPTFWEFLGEVLAPLVHEEIMSFLELSTLLDESAKNKCGAKLLASICQEISSASGHGPKLTLEAIWKNSNTKLAYFVPESDEESFLEKNRSWLQKCLQ